MEDPNKDYLSNYRSFFESLLKSVDLDYPLPVKVANYNLTEHEIAGEITTWCLQYLNERNCPTSLASILCRRVLEEISRIEPELCGYRPQEQVYHPLKLMQETIRKLAEVCTLYTDNARLSELPPPPSSILYDPIISMYGIKNGRRTMEDRHIAIQDLHRLFNVKNAVGPASYYAVFDGHNGCDAATYANCHLHHYLVQSEHYPHNPEAALREAFTTTDKRLIEKTAKGSSESGTTAVCALIRPEESMLYLAWLGDSQAILVSRGGAYQLVKPHRPDQPDEMKRIIQMGGSVLYVGTWRVDGNLAVSRAIGDKMYKPYIVSEPDIRVVPLTGKEDYLILASDGLWDFLSEKMVVHAVDSYLAENKD